MSLKYYARLALCVACLAALLAAGCGPTASDGELGTGEITIPSYTIKAPASGKILGLIIAKGERITRDQPLFAISDQETDGEEKRLAGELAIAEAELKRLETGTPTGVSPAELAALQANFSKAQQKAAKMNNLLAMGAVSRRQAQDAQAEMQRASAAVQAASQQAAVKPSTPEAIAAQKEKVNQLRQQHQNTLMRQQANEAVSPATGIITEKLLDNNAQAAKDQPVLKLTATESCSVTFRSSSAAAANLQPGQEVRFIAAGLPAPFIGKITAVTRDVIAVTNGKVTEITAESDNRPADLKEGASVKISLPAK